MLARSAMASVTIQNIGGDSIHPIGSTIGTAMRGSSSGNVIGTATASFSIIEGERPTLINVSARLYLLRLTIPCRGFASAAFCMILSRAFPNCIDSGGASFTVASLTPENVKLTIGLGRQL